MVLSELLLKKEFKSLRWIKVPNATKIIACFERHNFLHTNNMSLLQFLSVFN